MRTRNVLFGTAFLLAVLLLGVGNAFAQQPATAPTGCVKVIDGDSLWIFNHSFNLAALAVQNPDMDPPLDDTRRQFTTKYNQLGVKIFEGEVICGVTRSRSRLIPDAALKAATGFDTGISINQVPLPPAPAKMAELQGKLDKVNQAYVNAFWVLLAILALAILFLSEWRRSKRATKAIKEAFESYRESSERAIANEQAAIRRIVNEGELAVARTRAEIHDLYNPYTATPVVRGGLLPTEPTMIEYALLREAYRDQAISQYLPYTAATATRLLYRVGPIECGMLSGHVRVRGIVAPGATLAEIEAAYEQKILVPQLGYRTTVHLPDDTERVVYSLAACCNPVRTGNWIEGAGNDFVFTPMAVGATVAPAPVAPQPVLPVEEPVCEFPTPTGGRIVVFGPGPVHSEVGGDTKNASLTVTVVAPKEAETEPAPKMLISHGAGGSGGSGTGLE